MSKTHTLATLFILILCGCAIDPTHQALKQGVLPELIPVRKFVADLKFNSGYDVSPDGKKLAWIEVDGTRPAVFVKTIGRQDTKSFPIFPRYFRWAADSQHLLFVADKGGDENTHISLGTIGSNSVELTDLTPYEQTAAHIVLVIENDSKIVISTNRRDKKVFDLIAIDIATGQHTELARNPGNVASWVVNRRGKLIGRISQAGQVRSLQLKQESTDEDWKTTAQWNVFDSCHLIEISDDGKWAWALSNRGRDKIALVKMDLATGHENVVYTEPNVDLGNVYISRKTLLPVVAYANPDYPKVELFDHRYKQVLANLMAGKPAAVSITSVDDNERMVTLSVTTDKGTTRHYLYDIESDTSTLLGEDSLGQAEISLANNKPISFQSRDGLILHGYLTLPVGVKSEQLPMVLEVHGGPWARQTWTSGAKWSQFLANRGYAVLRINYRGSTGYGRAFTEKAIGEFAGKMHDDLIDGVTWAIQTGIADPKKIAISGVSYGGYAALVGLTFTPEVFACGMVGPTDLARLLETVPEHWELEMPWWHRYVGDPKNPSDRAKMDAKSPLYKVEAVTKPLLIEHGRNDPRVKIEQSDRMVAALRKAGKQVDYVVFENDGHGARKWTNNLKSFRKNEDFLASCLGGRSSGFDFYQLGAWAF